MPLPLIPIIAAAIAAATAGVGVKKGIDAKNDMDLAKSVNSEAQRIARTAEKEIETAKESATKAIESLGKKKVEILSGSINDFVLSFERIKNIDFQDSQGLDELKHFNPQSPEFIQLKKVSMEATDIAINGLGALGSGALLAFGTYNVVMGGLGGLLVTATTGTALSSLTGVAATNATLAWLGGGALAAGGFGMAGGMAVLGGLVAGPALAIGGSMLAKQADKAYWDASSNRETAKTFAEQAKGICSLLNAIEKRATQLCKLIHDLDMPFSDLVLHMKSVIQNNGTDWSHYSSQDKQEIYKCVQIAQVIKMVLDTSLLSESGELMPESETALLDGQNFLESLFGIEYSGEEVDIEDSAQKQERLVKLRTYTDDAEVISNIALVAFDQEELAELLHSGTEKIYLCGDSFVVPVSQKNKCYIGINNPAVHIGGEIPENWVEQGIEFVGCTVDNLPRTPLSLDNETKEAQLEAGNGIGAGFSRVTRAFTEGMVKSLEE